MASDKILDDTQRTHVINRLKTIYSKYNEKHFIDKTRPPSNTELWPLISSRHIEPKINIDAADIHQVAFHKLFKWEALYPERVIKMQIEKSKYDNLEEIYPRYIDRLCLGATEQEAMDILQHFEGLTK